MLDLLSPQSHFEPELSVHVMEEETKPDKSSLIHETQNVRQVARMLRRRSCDIISAVTGEHRFWWKNSCFQPSRGKALGNCGDLTSADLGASHLFLRGWRTVLRR